MSTSGGGGYLLTATRVITVDDNSLSVSKNSSNSNTKTNQSNNNNKNIEENSIKQGKKPKIE